MDARTMSWWTGERRAIPREACMIRARIEADGLPPLDCTIWDMTATGARIVVGEEEVPDVVDLVIPLFGLTHRATIRWRSAGQIGVSFAAVA